MGSTAKPLLTPEHPSGTEAVSILDSRRQCIWTGLVNDLQPALSLPAFQLSSSEASSSMGYTKP